MTLLTCVQNTSPSNATGTPAGSATNSPTTPENATSNRICIDTSEHKVSFVELEPGVQLEVLDWGGTGETLVLLTGLGNNAHVFDEFAYQFDDRFHVIGITRRGFGRSSQPAQDYDVDTRARDDITVLDKLNIREAVFVGHSVSGTEMNKLGAVYPDRVKKLVYLEISGRVGGQLFLNRRLPQRILRRIWNRCNVWPQPMHVSMDTESLSQRYVI
jgi:pimeloyl-ACP methyl ester carboxylesterase